jgi:hypothetical protein
MPNPALSESQVIELAKQLPPETRRSLAIALLRDVTNTADLGSLRRRSRAELVAVLNDRGMNIDRMTPDEIEQAIEQICRER